MNTKHQKNYILSITPKVLKAVADEYPCRPFINTRYVHERIVNNPQDYPILSTKSGKHIKDCITTVCIQQKMRQFSNRTHFNGGTIFVRKVRC